MRNWGSILMSLGTTFAESIPIKHVPWVSMLMSDNKRCHGYIYLVLGGCHFFPQLSSHQATYLYIPTYQIQILIMTTIALRFIILLALIFIVAPSAMGFLPYMPCRVACNSAYLSCMHVYGMSLFHVSSRDADV